MISCILAVYESLYCMYTKSMEEEECLDKMKKFNKQCLLDTPRTVRFSEKNLASYN